MRISFERVHSAIYCCSQNYVHHIKSTGEMSHVSSIRKSCGGVVATALLITQEHSISCIWPFPTSFLSASAKSLQWCLTLRDPIDWSPPGSSVHGNVQARMLEWVVISFSRGLPDTAINSPSPSYVSCFGRWVLYHLGLPEKPSEGGNLSVQVCNLASARYKGSWDLPLQPKKSILDPFLLSNLSHYLQIILIAYHFVFWPCRAVCNKILVP